jgi:hypothetical protein
MKGNGQVAAFALAPQAFDRTSELCSGRNGKRDSTDVASFRAFHRASHHDAFFSSVLPPS